MSEAMPELRAVVVGLTSQLRRHDFAGHATAGITQHLTLLTKDWLVSHRWEVEEQARLPCWRRVNKRSGIREYQGVVDVVARQGELRIAIEIDRTNKKWSLEKLRCAAAEGMGAIWIRWGSECLVNIPDDVELIRVPMTGFRGSSRRFAPTGDPLYGGRQISGHEENTSTSLTLVARESGALFVAP